MPQGQQVNINDILPVPTFKNEDEYWQWMEKNFGTTLRPWVRNAIRALAPNRLKMDLVNDFLQGKINLREYGDKNKKGLARSVHFGIEDIGQRVLSKLEQRKGLSKEEADKKALDHLWNTAPPPEEKAPVREKEKPAFAKALAGKEAKTAEGAEGAAAAGEGAAPEMPPEKKARPAPGEISPEEQKEAGRALKREQRAAPEMVPPEQEATPEKLPPKKEEAPKEAAPETVAPEEEGKTAEQLAAQKEQEAALAKQEEQRGPAAPQAAEGAAPPAFAKAPAGEEGEAPEQGQEAMPEQVAPEEEKGAASALQTGVNQAKSAAAAAAKPEVEKAAQAVTTPVIELIIDFGWNIEAGGMFITCPLLAYLFYLDLVSEGIDVPFLGTVKVVKMTFIQKVEAFFQIVVALLVYVIILAIIALNVYIVFSWVEAVVDFPSDLYSTIQQYRNLFGALVD